MTDRKHSENRKRTESVNVRMTPEERRLLTAEAGRTGSPESTLLRQAFLASLSAVSEREQLRLAVTAMRDQADDLSASPAASTEVSEDSAAESGAYDAVLELLAAGAGND